ncbi:MAG: DUF2939 domain-containing protein [Sulfuricellaceae bacterium]
MSKTITLSIVIALIAFCTWFYFTPHLAVNGMKTGAEAKDAAKLSSYVNYPALKESLKAGFSAKLTSGAAKESKLLGVLGAALADAVVNPTIDALITPESLAMIMRGDKPQPANNATKNTTQSKPSETETSMAYESFDRFVVTIKKKGATGEPFGLVFNREGLFSWKLSALRLPL